jgi:hypothetical protein
VYCRPKLCALIHAQTSYDRNLLLAFLQDAQSRPTDSRGRRVRYIHIGDPRQSSAVQIDGKNDLRVRLLPFVASALRNWNRTENVSHFGCLHLASVFDLLLRAKVSGAEMRISMG